MKTEGGLGLGQILTNVKNEEQGACGASEFVLMEERNYQQANINYFYDQHLHTYRSCAM